ncbi:MAG: ADP-ribosylglycohydrolase family protein [Methanoregula sp.]|uniref:ADP-ribosylglycohydrolase family protein n=1 Tax=Methanoregula sp. TaxID=2052170 RepID=UPI003BB1CEE5
MLERIKGCMLGAAVGDALGMPNESTMPSLSKMRYGFRKAYKGHPNDTLAPGQYTDDTQMMLLVATLLADGRYTDERYGLALKELYTREILRFPDGSVTAACEHMISGKTLSSGVKSTTAGCLPPTLPFALVYPNVNEGIERAVRACSVTHTHPAAHAAVSTFVTLLYHAIHDNPDPLKMAFLQAQNEDDLLGGKIHTALNLEKEGVETETAVLKIGNDVSLYQTLPIAFFLISRYDRPSDLLTVAAHVGGNTDTIGFLCGAYLGARKGAVAIPEDLLSGLEDRQRIEILGQRIFDIYTRKLEN